jgi:hypothetical protein
MNNTDLIKKDWLNPLDVEKEYSISKSTLAKWRMINKMQKTGTFEHSFRKHLNSVYTFI